MCFRDLIDTLRAQGISVTPTQVRWAIDSGQLTRPRVDGSLRFDFTDEHLNQLRAYFAAKAKRENCKNKRPATTQEHHGGKSNG